MDKYYKDKGSENMQKIKCKECGKVLFEAEGQAHIRKKCPKCKTVNEIIMPNLSDEEFQRFKNEWEHQIKHGRNEMKIIKK